MKFFLPVLAFLGLLLVAGCTTPGSRIRSHQAAFDEWPAEVQGKISAGRVDVGFTPEMARVALGDPDHVLMRTDAHGEGEVWVYYDHGPRFLFGFGMGTARGSTGVGGGVAVGDSGFRDREVLRLVFAEGRVAAVESVRK